MIVLRGVEQTKRGLAAPLLFLTLVLTAVGSAQASPALWLAAVSSLCATLYCTPAGEQRRLSPLAASVLAFALWLVLTNRWVGPYTAAAPYQAAFLVGGFLLGGRADGALLYRTVLAFGVLIAIWAVWQQLARGEARAHGLFITPATLSSVINLILLPGLVLIAAGSRRYGLAAALFVLAFALVAAQSRGGWIAFAAGVGAAGVYMHRAGLPVRVRQIAIAAVLCLAAVLAAFALHSTPSVQGAYDVATAIEDPQTSLRARLELYELAAEAIARAPLVAGMGYQSFYYVLEAGRPQVPSFSQGMTYFVHNDYLQTLLELGVPGLAALLLMVVGALGQAWRAATKASPPEERALVVAIVAAVATIATHALGDFPFYIPLCVLIFGAVLGLLDAAVARRRGPPAEWLPQRPLPALARRIALAAIGTVMAWILVVPAAAEAASTYAQRQWRAARSESAAFWFEAARRIDPRDWRYHWYAGQFWRAQAFDRPSPAAARFADRAFAAGYAANPREVRNLYDRLVLQRGLRKLLDKPADPETMRAWANQAVLLSPADPAIHAERERVMKLFVSQ